MNCKCECIANGSHGVVYLSMVNIYLDYHTCFLVMALVISMRFGIFALLLFSYIKYIEYIYRSGYFLSKSLLHELNEYIYTKNS